MAADPAKIEIRAMVAIMINNGIVIIARTAVVTTPPRKVVGQAMEIGDMMIAEGRTMIAEVCRSFDCRA